MCHVRWQSSIAGCAHTHKAPGLHCPAVQLLEAGSIARAPPVPTISDAELKQVSRPTHLHTHP